MLGRLAGRTAAAAGRSRGAVAAPRAMGKPGGMASAPARNAATAAAPAAAPSPAMYRGVPPNMMREMMHSIGPNSQRLALAQSMQAGGGTGAAGRSSAVKSDAKFVLAIIAASLGLTLATMDEETLAEEQAKAEVRFAKAGIRMPRGEDDGEAKVALIRHLSHGDPKLAEGLMKLDVSDLVGLFIAQSALRGLVDEMAGPMGGDAHDHYRALNRSAGEL